ncbi:uncharacterized protein METZ01_LOCUS228588 [marine metagenome]|uniref:Uncharacterized protein n=1 Tax=marine metagenome TaxID=408172 RepID=A0A382GLR1_9ZZZZ
MWGHTERVSGEESAVLRNEIGAFIQGTGQVPPLRGLLASVCIISGYPDQVRLKTAVFGMRLFFVAPYCRN